MLNRSNRMLSANTNRLNLGTRTLATGAGLNIGCSTLRARLDSMRVAHPGQMVHDKPRSAITWEFQAVIRPDFAWSKSRKSGMAWPLASKASLGRPDAKAGSASALTSSVFAEPRSWQYASSAPRAAMAARRLRMTGRTGLV
ncbi:hypothetical protein EP7_003856 [Isosphaeraceae bacterium EP7]